MKWWHKVKTKKNCLFCDQYTEFYIKTIYSIKMLFIKKDIIYLMKEDNIKGKKNGQLETW